MDVVRAVLFDLDGTLTDTFELWYQAVADLVQQHAGYELEREEYRRLWWGMDGRNKIRGLLEPPEDQVEALYRELVERLLEKVALVKALPGAREAVEKLSAAVPLAVISNGPMEFLEAQLRQVDMSQFFRAKVADAEPKPNPGGILRACQALEVRPQEAVFVGDSRFDVEAAANAGVQCIVIPENARRDEALEELISQVGAR